MLSIVLYLRNAMVYVTSLFAMSLRKTWRNVRITGFTEELKGMSN